MGKRLIILSGTSCVGKGTFTAAVKQRSQNWNRLPDGTFTASPIGDAKFAIEVLAKIISHSERSAAK